MPPSPSPSPPPSPSQPLSHHWWNTNIPPSEHTSTCPSYLLYAQHDPRARACVSTPHAEFTQRLSWPQVRALVAENRLEGFRRVPSRLRAYRQWCEGVAREYGSVEAFVLRERVGWDLEELQARVVVDAKEAEVEVEMDEVERRRRAVERVRKGFEDNSQYKILPNDWPYALEARIDHFILWTRFALPEDPASSFGDLSAACKAVVDGFVRRRFVRGGDDGGGGGGVVSKARGGCSDDDGSGRRCDGRSSGDRDDPRGDEAGVVESEVGEEAKSAVGGGMKMRRIMGSEFGEVRDVLWFRNWSGLKSVHAVEHVHVLVLREGVEGPEQEQESEVQSVRS